jgi:hypothetical protein
MVTYPGDIKTLIKSSKGRSRLTLNMTTSTYFNILIILIGIVQNKKIKNYLAEMTSLLGYDTVSMGK